MGKASRSDSATGTTLTSSGITKNKRLGQHFLDDPGFLQRIVDAIRITRDQHIIEIGAGVGALTAKLVQTGALVTALEFDRRFIPRLTRTFKDFPNLRILHGDALSIPTAQLLCFNGDCAHPVRPENLPVCTTRMVGNLPYASSSQIILRFAKVAELVDMHFLLQRELAARLTAAPGNGNFGAFTLASGVWRDSLALFDLPPQAFDPPPKVFSTLVQLGWYRPACTDQQQLDAFHNLVHRAFQQRRKQLGNALAGLVSRETFTRLEIAPSQRPENLALPQWLALARAMTEKKTF